MDDLHFYVLLNDNNESLYAMEHRFWEKNISTIVSRTRRNASAGQHLTDWAFIQSKAKIEMTWSAQPLKPTETDWTVTSERRIFYQL